MSFFQKNRAGQAKQVGQRGRVHTAVLAGGSTPANATARNQGAQAAQAGRKPSVRRDLAKKQAAVSASVVTVPYNLRRRSEASR